MKKVLISIIVLAVTALLGINALGLGATATGVSDALRGSPGTFIYAKDAFMVFSWQSGGQYAFLITKTTGELVRDVASIPGFAGQKMDTMTAIQFVRMLESLGFKQITPQEIPPAVATTFGSWKYALGLIGTPKLTLLVLPVGAVDFYNPLPEKDG